MAFEDTLKSISLNADASISGFTGVSGLASGGGPSTYFKISTITGTDTITTTTSHGLSVGDVVYISNNSTATNNGGFTVSSIPSATSFKTGATYTNTSASGIVSKTNFNQLYRFVKITGAKQAGLCTANDDYSIGVLQNKPQYTGQAAQVGFLGVSYVITGAGVASKNIAAGSKIMSDTLGAAVVAAGTPLDVDVATGTGFTVSATTTVVATLATATAFKVGDTVVVSGATSALHNGTFVLTAVASDNLSVTYTNLAAPATQAGAASSATRISTVRQPVIAGTALASSSTPGELIPVLLAAR
jgi:hypothetical protein